MSKEHNKRLTSAAVMLAVVFVIGMLDVKFITWVFLGAIGYFAFVEASKLWGVKSEESLPFLAISWVAAYFFKDPVLLVFLIFLVMAAKLAYDKSIEKNAFLPIAYPVVGILFTWSLYLNWGMQSLLWLLIIVALSDVGAYYTGKNFGKTSFSPTSPNKTLEGVFGGMAFASIIGGILIASTSEIGFFAAILLALLTSVASVFGDLFESYLKRDAGVKDSGDLIPGHGGMLDRIDGYLFASIMLYVLLELGK